MKTIVATLLALALMCLALPASAEKADDTSPLFQRAAAKEQMNLDNLKIHVLSRLNELVQDGVVKPARMENLYRAVKLYRDNASQAKTIYGNHVVEDLNPKVNQIVAWYYSPLLRNGAGHQTDIKKNLAELTGVNIGHIEESFSFGGLIGLILVILILLCLANFSGKNNHEITAVVFCMIAVVTIILLIVGLCGV